MNIRIVPKSLRGTVTVPSSKSMGHRELICAALAKGRSTIENISWSQDMEATCRVLRAFGVSIETRQMENGRVCCQVDGGLKIPAAVQADCGESGSTLRFLIPVGQLGTGRITYTGQGKLISRPLELYYAIWDRQGIAYSAVDGGLPLTVEGRLQPGRYELPGSVSSQFVSGLLFALPLLDKDSEIHITSPLESQSYAALTLQCLKKYGIAVRRDGWRTLYIQGNQQYLPQHSRVEGDYSQAAFWLAAGTLGGSLAVQGLDADSLQGDRAVLSYMEQMGAKAAYQKGAFHVQTAKTKGTVIDARDCPDIIPVLAVLAACSAGETKVIHAERLRLKECDRLHAIQTELTALGADIEEFPDGLCIRGKGQLKGGTVNSWNDHRIAMAMAVAAVRCRESVLIKGAESVAKSYPAFWQDYEALGGCLEKEEE